MSSGQLIVSPPRDDDFNNNDLEEGEEKMELSLDEIIKLNRDTMMHSPVRSNNSHRSSDRHHPPPPPPPSSSSRRGRGGDARDAIRRSAASRSAAIRQGRVMESRSNLSRPYTPPAMGSRSSRSSSGSRNDVFKRSGLPRRHLTPGDRVDIYEGGAGKLKISVVNENSKPAPVERAPPPPSRGRMNWGSDDYDCPTGNEMLDDDFDYHRPPVQIRMRVAPKMDESVPRRHRTLDSLFASIKEQRESGRVPSSTFGSGRFRAQSFRRRA